MNEFSFYLSEGINHITDLSAMDHMLFIITLCAFYRPDEWKRILVLVTAFTVGHSVTLLFSALDLLRIDQDLVEFLIPVTILLTSFYNVFPKNESKRKLSWNYLLALAFGLIHGMGFSNFFRTMVLSTDQNSFLKSLLAFNIGIEIGQVMIVISFMLLLFLFTLVFKVKHREWNLYVSGAGGGLALTMIIHTFI